MVHPIHVGYIRWSDPTQEKGDSERRQRKSITDDAARLGVTISRWMQDEGLSASTGENLTKGELGRFLAEVHAGTIPRGSVLYLDEPTRLTRLGTSKAMRILADLEDAEVSIRLSARGQTLAGDSLCDLLGFLIESAAGHAFAKELGRKVHGAWQGKRDGARSAPGKEVITSNTPYGIEAAGGTYTVGKGWIGRSYVAHPEESPNVVLIFELARDGYSPRGIAIELNKRGILPPNAARGRKSRRGGPRAWRPETIYGILKDPLYLDGTYQPCRGSSKKGKKADGPPVVGHYPIFLPDGLWEKANVEMAKRSNGCTGPHRSGPSNLFTGIAKCACCGGAISLRSGNERGRIPSLYCINGRVGSCPKKKPIHRWRLEAAILSKLSHLLSPEEILSDLQKTHQVVDRGVALDRMQAEVKTREKDLGRLVDRVLSLSASENADLYEERLKSARHELADLKQRLATLEQESHLAEAEISQCVAAARDFRGLVYMTVYGEPRAELCGPPDDLWKAVRDVEKLQVQLLDKVDPSRVKLKAVIRRLVSGIVVDLETGKFALTLKAGQVLKGDVDEPVDVYLTDDAIPGGKRVRCFNRADGTC